MHRIIRIKASPRVVSKSREERIAARERSFRAYFGCGAEVVLNMHDIVFQRFPIFGGLPIEVDGCTYAEGYPDGVVGVADATKALDKPGMMVLPSGFERNLLCGVLDIRNEVRGLALLDRIDFTDGTISLYTPVRPGVIKGIQGGELYLDREGRELGKARLLGR
jgi:polynucleotide 5'-hydroxyl-kinase GRC3/NOL9